MILRVLDCFGTEPIDFPEFFKKNSERNDEYKERGIVSEEMRGDSGCRNEKRMEALQFAALSYLDLPLSLDCKQLLNLPFLTRYWDTSRLHS